MGTDDFLTQRPSCPSLTGATRGAAIMGLGGMLVLLAAACDITETAEEPPRMAEIGRVSRSDVDELSHRRIFFAHQSVGNNILQGVREVLAESGALSLKIAELPKDGSRPDAGLVHARLGKNGDPTSKVEAFSEALNGELGTWAEIALVKLCFVDVNRQTDVPAVFQAYRRALTGLRDRHPGIAFVHVTVPLVSRPRDWRAVVKRLLGMTPDGDLDNVRRGQYNEMLRRTYQGREPVFDIAQIESTLPDGGRELFSHEGRHYEALAGGYTPDGGHLNDLGRQRVARGLLAVLAAIPRR